MKNKQWLRIEHGSYLHVIPIDDLFPHEDVGYACKCKLRMTRLEHGFTLLTHTAYDGREAHEKDSKRSVY